jgi:hypothetical protein
MAAVSKAAQVPKNYPTTPSRYPLNIFRLQVDAARRYLFDGELKEALTSAAIPLDVLTGAGEPVINVAQVSHFTQELRGMVGDEQAARYGREAFQHVSPLFPRATASTSHGRSVSSSDKFFLKVRDAMATLNKTIGSNFIVKWHGGAEADLFEDTAQHCYGFVGKGLACYTLTGYLEEAIIYLSGVKMSIVESECMANGALACRWHCRLA